MLTNVFVTWSGMSEGCGRWYRNHDTLASMLSGKSMTLWEINRAPAPLHMSNASLRQPLPQVPFFEATS